MRLLLSALIVLSAVLCPLPTSAKDIDWTNVSEEFDLLQWNRFKSTYEKDYGSAEEEAHRFQIFQDNMARARVLNAKNPDATFDITPFVDLDPTEFKRMLGGRPPVVANAAVKRLSPPVNTDDAPRAPPTTNVDWRGKAVSAIKDQGQCGSCWAFSATETVESAYFMKYGFDSKFTLSPQQIVDCDHEGEDSGCDGGWPSSAFDYLKQAGQESESAYPYKAVTGDKCLYNASDVEAKITGWTYSTPDCTHPTSCPNQDELTLFKSLTAVGPISICVDAEPWQLYAGGIFKEGCKDGYNDLDHCVQLVGYNSSQGGYWIARNSWGTTWGIQGYIYLAFGHNVCGLADQATFPAIA